MIRAFIRFWFHRTTQNWRLLRLVSRDALPKYERSILDSNGE